MSFKRLIYYSAISGGYAAFLGWLLAELFLDLKSASGSYGQVALVAALVGAAIGGGLSLVAGMANVQWKQLLRRLGPGLLGGGLGGIVGGLIGNLVFSAFHWPLAFGWMIMGSGIGVVDGLYERSASKIRNGLLGGAVGGLIGGLLFNPIDAMIRSSSGMSSRATAFVILGICIGALIGLVQVVLKQAWLTVVDGYRTGRQLILSRPVTVIGRAEHLPLPFLGDRNKDLEPEHLRISRQPTGAYVIEDNQSKLGTHVNSQRLQAPLRLKDGDMIKLGGNFVRFNERVKSAGEASGVATASTSAPGGIFIAPPPPPPVRARTPAATAGAVTGATPAPAPPAPGKLGGVAPPPLKPKMAAPPPPPPVKPHAAAPPPPKPAGTAPPAELPKPPPPRKGPGGLPPPPPPPKKP